MMWFKRKSDPPVSMYSQPEDGSKLKMWFTSRPSTDADSFFKEVAKRVVSVPLQDWVYTESIVGRTRPVYANVTYEIKQIVLEATLQSGVKLILGREFSSIDARCWLYADDQIVAQDSNHEYIDGTIYEKLYLLHNHIDEARMHYLYDLERPLREAKDAEYREQQKHIAEQERKKRDDLLRRL